MSARRSGFTIIEMLIVVIVVGTLAMIAIPYFARSRQRTFYAAMKSDLKNLVSAEEIYYSVHSYNYAGAAGLNAAIAAGLEFAPSQGVGVTFQNVNMTGWSAEATHAGLDPITQKCAIFIGGAPVLAPAVSQGLIGCIGETD